MESVAYICFEIVFIYFLNNFFYVCMYIGESAYKLYAI